MSRSFQATVVSCALLLGACALADRQEEESGVDPSLPALDAGYDPEPVKGDPAAKPDGTPGAKKDAGGKGAPTGEGDAGTTVAPPDAGPSIPRPAPGEVIVTEVMYNPFASEPDAEWFEIYNAASSPRSLSGMFIADGGGRSHVIGAGVVIDAGAYAVLARNKAAAVAAKVPSAAILYEYGTGLPSNAGVLLLNGATGAVSLHDGSITVTGSSYGGWYSQSGGSSVQLKTLDANAASDATKWCLSFNAWATGSDKGTPGAPSDCP